MQKWKVGTFIFNGANIKSSKNPKARTDSIDVYVAQCGECFKWRVISTEEEYEDIRSKHIEDPFVCNKKPNVSCEDPADIEYDSSRTWVADKPNAPKTPRGFEREVILRRDYSKMDVHYITPSGKKVRASPGIAAFLEEHPEYKDVLLEIWV